MFKTKEWVQACIAGMIFVISYNLVYLHTSLLVALAKSIIIACEANLILLIYLKLKQFLNV